MLVKLMTTLFLSLCFACGSHVLEDVNTLNEVQGFHIDHVITHEYGVLLSVDGLWLDAEAVQVTSQGVLVREEGVWMSISNAMEYNTYKTWKCNVCGYINPQGRSNCGNSANHPKK